MRCIDCIVVHHSVSPRTTTFEEIKRWHLERKRPFNDIGYHFVVVNKGVVRRGRTIDDTGAHVRGHNRRTLGICVTGDNTVSTRCWDKYQKTGLLNLIGSLHLVLGYIPVKRHSDLAATLCPGLDDAAWYDLMKPLNLYGEQ